MDPDRIPPMVKDYYWDKQNCPIPYTEASMHFKRKTYKGSADEIMYAPNIVMCLSVCLSDAPNPSRRVHIAEFQRTNNTWSFRRSRRRTRTLTDSRGSP